MRSLLSIVENEQSDRPAAGTLTEAPALGRERRRVLSNCVRSESSTVHSEHRTFKSGGASIGLPFRASNGRRTQGGRPKTGRSYTHYVNSGVVAQRGRTAYDLSKIRGKGLVERNVAASPAVTAPRPTA